MLTVAIFIVVCLLVAIGLLLLLTADRWFEKGYHVGYKIGRQSVRDEYPHLDAYDAMCESDRRGREATRRAFERTTIFDRPFDWMESDGPDNSV